MGIYCHIMAVVCPPATRNLIRLVVCLAHKMGDGDRMIPVIQVRSAEDSAFEDSDNESVPSPVHAIPVRMLESNSATIESSFIDSQPKASSRPPSSAPERYAFLLLNQFYECPRNAKEQLAVAFDIPEISSATMPNSI